MTLLNLHDRPTLEESVAAMDAEALAATVQHGGLSQLAESVAMAELARRVLADEGDYGREPEAARLGCSTAHPCSRRRRRSSCGWPGCSAS